MVQAMINLGEREDRVLTIVRGKFGLKNKSEAINFLIRYYDDEVLEPPLRPEYIQKLQKIEKRYKDGKFKTYSSIKALREAIEKDD